MEHEKSPNGRALHGRYLGGVGLTMFEWFHLPRFLEIASDADADAHPGHSN
jgi:hypothetical protein